MYPFTTCSPRLLTRSPAPTTIEYTVTTAPIPPTSLLSRYLLLALSALVKALVVGSWIVVGSVKYTDEVVKSGGSLEDVYCSWWGLGRWVGLIGLVGLGDGGGGGENDGGEGWLVRHARGLEWWWIGVGVWLGAWWAGRRGYTEESLLIMRNLGIQTRTCPSSTFSPIFLFSPLLTILTPFATFFFTPILNLLTTIFTKLFPNTPPPDFTSRFSNFLSPGGTTRFIPTSQIQDVWIHEGFVGFEVRFFLGVVVNGEEEIVVVFPRTLPGRRVLEVVWRGLRGCLYERGIGEDGVGDGKR